MSLFPNDDFRQKFKSDMRQCQINWENVKTVEDLVLIHKTHDWIIYFDVKRKDDEKMLAILLEKGLVKEINNE